MATPLIELSLAAVFGVSGWCYGTKLKQATLLVEDLGFPHALHVIPPRIRDDLTSEMVSDHMLYSSLSRACYGASAMALLMWMLGRI